MFAIILVIVVVIAMLIYASYHALRVVKHSKMHKDFRQIMRDYSTVEPSHRRNTDRK